MFYKFADIDTTLILINVNRISHIFSDDFDNSLYHIILVDDLDDDLEITIDHDQYIAFVNWLSLCKMI